jgi:transcriptional regulator with XRE-family HTH domain
MPATFTALFRQLVQTYQQTTGTKADLARELGVRPSTISHLLADRTTPGLELCLRFAAVTGVSPSHVLRAAGKDALATLLESLYGPAADRAAQHRTRLRPNDRMVLECLNAMRSKTYKAMLVVIEATADQDRRQAAQRRHA